MLAIPRQRFVEQVDERGQSARAKDAAERSGETELGEEHDAATAVAGNRRAVAEYQPPTFGALFLGHPGEQARGLLIGKRKECQLPTAVERGDEPRRAAAEPSAAGVKQYRSRKARGRR